MADTTHDVQLLVGCHYTLPNITLNDLTEKNVKEIGAPEYTPEEQEFAKRLSEWISPEMKKGTLIYFKISNWQENMDIDLEREIFRISKDTVFPGSTDVGDVSWMAPTVQFFTAEFILGAPGHS